MQDHGEEAGYIWVPAQPLPAGWLWVSSWSCGRVTSLPCGPAHGYSRTLCVSVCVYTSKLRKFTGVNVCTRMYMCVHLHVSARLKD